MNRIESTPLLVRAISPMGTARVAIALVVLTGVTATTFADDDAAVAGADVRAGLAAFEAGDFVAAVASFERALELAPENHRILFDLGCAVQAAGDLPRAEELLKQATQSPDVNLAASAHFNLGGIKADAARAIFGNSPSDAPPEARERGESVLLQAVAHYRAALELNRDHEAARKNLELLRLWLKNMRELWRQRDLESQAAQSPLEQIERLLAENRDRRRELRGLQTQSPGMARHTSLMQVASEQKQWQQQLDNVREALETELQGIEPGTRDSLLDTLSEARSDSNAAVRLIKRKDLESAIQSLQRADASARDVYCLLAGLPQQVQFAISQQTATLELTESLQTSGSSDDPRQPGPTGDTRFEQSGIGRILESIRQRAPLELEMLNASSPPITGDTADQSVDPQQAAAIQQYRGLIERALQLGGELPEWSDQTEALLAEQDWKGAIAREQSILRRLREILESPDGQQDQSQDSNQSSDSQPGEGDPQDDPSQDSPGEKSGDKSGDENPRQPDKSGAQQPTQPDGEPRSESQQPQDANEPTDKQDLGDTGKDEQTEQTRRDGEQIDQQHDSRPADSRSGESQTDPGAARKPLSGMTEEQVESLLQKVRERERYRRELEKQVQRLIQATQRARKDW